MTKVYSNGNPNIVGLNPYYEEFSKERKININNEKARVLKD